MIAILLAPRYFLPHFIGSVIVLSIQTTDPFSCIQNIRGSVVTLFLQTGTPVPTLGSGQARAYSLRAFYVPGYLNKGIIIKGIILSRKYN